MLIAFHKPFGVLSQFTSDGSAHRTLAEFGFPPRIYPLGRLDADSEGLLLLSDEGDLNARLLQPGRGHCRIYWALVERKPEEPALATLRQGVALGTAQLSNRRATLPCTARILDPQPTVPPRNPPVRFRKTVEDWWIELGLVEGKNHQVRRMTAAVGHPTVRLIRVAIGGLDLWASGLEPGHWRELGELERRMVFAGDA